MHYECHRRECGESNYVLDKCSTNPPQLLDIDTINHSTHYEWNKS